MSRESVTLEVRQFAMQQLRMGILPLALSQVLRDIATELEDVNSYLTAIKESDFRP